MIQKYRILDKSCFGHNTTNIQTERKPQSYITAIYIVPDISVQLFSACEMRRVCSDKVSILHSRTTRNDPTGNRVRTRRAT